MLPSRLITNALQSITSNPPSPSPDLLFLAGALSLFFLFKPPLPSLPCVRLHPRRRRRRPMDSGGSGSCSLKPLAFSSPESLFDWLRPRLPPDSLSSWGSSPGSKPVLNLWLEISQGESFLEEGPTTSPTPLLPPIRTVHVAIVRIHNARGKLLVESGQLLSDGAMRKRHRPLSEKMKPGESVEEAAIRAVREELGSKEVRIVPGSHEERVEEKASSSYPGLPARYVLHSVDAEVEGLPQEGEFWTEETGEGVGDGLPEKALFVRRHFWKWVDEDDVDGSKSCSAA